ncbi:hypothetical protein WOLCODRAFT_168046 [Wolfiporia cocos MD-104 SS10]|uniref:Uncharacterized protein n=1 Tax=Wolfiporia cocos (strain MD-104) TaxID=742152 RepID=A0A2H3JCK4_WOLCO|nr:hypothetical protein WOLCODRAFT_168046 [Wolfiporia cocos MD-104 SS10]
MRVVTSVANGPGPPSCRRARGPPIHRGPLTLTRAHAHGGCVASILPVDARGIDWCGESMPVGAPRNRFVRGDRRAAFGLPSSPRHARCPIMLGGSRQKVPREIICSCDAPSSLMSSDSLKLPVHTLDKYRAPGRRTHSR